MKTINLILTLLILSAGTVLAQDDVIPERQREKVKQLRIWKLTDKLNLTEEQSLKFFPAYNKNMDDQEQLRHERKRVIQDLKENGDALTEAKVSEKVDQMLEIEQKMLTRRKEFLKSLEGILTPKQRAILVAFDAEFLKDLAKNIEKRRENKK
ncbi:MAG: Spy/CpxP family protein refolding chaperone [Bacteroidetes bacterium]|nr:Spy/CpxP family protein refolding chaperone [Bacteroidota bacterium]